MKSLIFLSLFIIYTITSISQWQPDVRLTNDPASSTTPINNSWCIASNDDFIHVVWYDNRDGNYEIYYKHSTDRGASWGPDIRLTNNSAVSNAPSIAINGSKIYVAWYDYRDDNFEIYYKKSSNNGASWGNDVRLTYTSDRSRLPSIAVNGANIYLVWEEKELYTDIYFKRSTNEGQNWTIDTLLDNGVVGSHNPCISVSGITVHIAWYDSRGGYTEEIYYKRSTNGGVFWGPDTKLTNNSGFSGNPSICSIGFTVHLAWYDNTNYHDEIYYKRSTDGGNTWGPLVIQSNWTGDSWNPSFALSGSNVHLVWYNDDTVGINYKRSSDEGINWDTQMQIASDSAFFPSRPSISVSDTTVYIVWCDFRYGNGEIYFKCNPNGNVVDIKNKKLLYPADFSLFQNYPNPFNPVTKIKFNVTSDSRFRGNDNVSLRIFDVLGRKIAVLVNEQLKPGAYEVEWDASDFPSGVYFYKLIKNDFTQTKKMVLLK